MAMVEMLRRAAKYTAEPMSVEADLYHLGTSLEVVSEKLEASFSLFTEKLGALPPQGFA